MSDFIDKTVSGLRQGFDDLEKYPRDRGIGVIRRATFGQPMVNQAYEHQQLH